MDGSPPLTFVEPLPDVELTLDEREVLDTVNRRVATGARLGEILDFLFSSTRALCPCDRIGLAFLDESGTRAVAREVRAAYGPLRLDAGYAEDLAGSSLAEVVRDGRPRIIRDLPAYLEARPGSRSTRLLVEEGVRSSMTCPLRVDDRTVGLLFRSSRRPDAYGQREVALHAAVAERLAQAVETAWRIEELAAANRAYLEMLGFVSHELKSPLSSLVMLGEGLLEGYRGALPEAQQNVVRRMVGRAEHLLAMVGDYLDLARLEGGDLRLKARPFDLRAELVEPAAELVRPELDARGCTLELDLAGAPVAAGDPDLLRVVLVNLLNNAAKYGAERVPIQLRVASSADRLSVIVKNQGPGFTEAERGRLFRRFSRLSAAPGAPRGTGLGLYNSRRIVELHGGRVLAESEPGAWAELGFELPQPLSPR